jgi:tripartite-type tricarboxylate transporter receptor subunit TctC
MVSYAGAGAGTTPDLTAGEFARRAGLDKLVFVPFRGTVPAATAVLQGVAQITFASLGPHLQNIESGKLRVLAAATPTRLPYAKDFPTFAEEGFAGFEMSTWFSLFAPKGTPAETVNQLNGYTRAVHDDPAIKKQLETQFVEPLILTQPEFAALVKADAAKWERIVRESGVKLE